MAIEVEKISDDLYRVSATAARWRGGETWTPSEPVELQDMVQELFKRGFYGQDIADAIIAADNAWLSHEEARVNEITIAATREFLRSGIQIDDVFGRLDKPKEQ